MAHASGQFPALPPSEIKETFVSQAVALLPGLKAAAAKALAEKTKQEEAIQERLKTMGRCPMNFEWMQVAGGYRCAGGAHFVPNSQLGDLLN